MEHENPDPDDRRARAGLVGRRVAPPGRQHEDAAERDGLRDPRTPLVRLATALRG